MKDSNHPMGCVKELERKVINELKPWPLFLSFIVTASALTVEGLG